MDPLADLGRYERSLRHQGFRLIAGVDEAVRVTVSAPLVAAAVILPEDFDLEGIDDSKALTAAERETCYARILGGAVAVAVRRATPARIDRRGLHRSNLWLLREAVRALPVRPDYVLTDGFPVPRLGLPSLAIRKGDAVTASVAAASIVAKVVRDRAMARYHRRFPAYGFDRNKGYGTAEHREALARFGPCPIHRRSFALVAALVSAGGSGAAYDGGGGPAGEDA